MRRNKPPTPIGSQRPVNTGALIQTTKKIGSLKPQFVGEIRLDPEELADIMRRNGVVRLSGHQIDIDETKGKFLIKLRVTKLAVNPEERKRKQDHADQMKIRARQRVEERAHEKLLKSLENSRIEAIAYEERERSIFEVEDD